MTIAASTDSGSSWGSLSPYKFAFEEWGSPDAAINPTANRTEYAIINVLLDAAGWPASQRDIDDSNPTEYSFWESSGGQSILSLIQTLERITGGTFYIDKSGNAKWESATYRSENKQTPEDSFNNTCNGLSYALDKKNIYNHIKINTAPPQEAETDSSGEEVSKTWYKYYHRFLSGYPNIYGDYSYMIAVARPDEDEYVASWGTPTVEAKYFIGGGTPTPTITITSQSRTECKINITNTDSRDIFVVSVSIDYVPLVDEEPDEGEPEEGGWSGGEYSVEVEDETSQSEYTFGLPRTKTVYVPFPMDYDVALNLANFYLNYYKDPVADVSATIMNDAEAKLVDILDVSISDRITIIVDELSLNADFYINKESHSISDGALKHEVTWILEKCESQRELFVLDVSTLDSGAILAPW